MTFVLNDEYLETKHIYGALCKFLRIGLNRIKNEFIKVENGKSYRYQINNLESNIQNKFCLKSARTKVSFYLSDDNDGALTNYILLKDLKDIIDGDKYVIIDTSLKKTIKAVKHSLNYGIFFT